MSLPIDLRNQISKVDAELQELQIRIQAKDPGALEEYKQVQSELQQLCHNKNLPPDVVKNLSVVANELSKAVDSAGQFTTNATDTVWKASREIEQIRF